MLRETARPDPGGGVVVAPDQTLLRSLTPDVRARLYAELSKDPLNFDQLSAFRFHGRSIDEWLGPDVTPDVGKLVDPLIIVTMTFLFLADLQSIRPQLGTGPAFQRLLKRLVAQATVQSV